ncbi:dihydrolipoyl dehydrogenase [Solemya pervernicosa gill symbiont]|uniref:Dihydrolipoyl dehydrogenase n=2 Tax=Gammaproteobacteria incertae sedis TaxID=118884 RepID=A0A1T2L7K9_9GAMM|nr:dihydrolipoyl dehydrogenase [Candidatus Reidiella endopervernicosa]OOZ41095.1 dihydrolipoyl dehydrogenase [Solemya pervernicosa gill symbiont]QKQ26256.1 dihydrolipoyl dehydrogenase [Candidatus Reidiella endopervernicosa]
MADTESYDVIVIGGGPAGYVAAIRCAQLGLKSACIDAGVDEQGERSLGGTCLNVGCIPSKALLSSSALYEQSVHHLTEHGIKTSGVTLDLKQMMGRKQQVVKELTGGIAALFKANGVTSIAGRAQLLADKQVKVVPLEKGRSKTLSAQQIILAPGSQPNEHKQVPFDGKRVVDSTGALSLSKVPKRLAVIGAGVIGLELGSVWRRLGAEVVLIDICDGLLPMIDKPMARQAQKLYQQQGLNFRFGCAVVGSKAKRGGIELQLETKQGSESETFDQVIVAVGRSPTTKGLLSKDCGVVLDKRGAIEVDGQCRTAVDGIYAIGDAVRGPMLAHKGSEEGVMVAELIAGHHAEVDYGTIPSVVYTEPEIAWCGQTEAELKAADIKYKVGSFPFAANGRARAGGDSSGMVKVVADAKSDRVLGVHMLGPHVSELIGQAVNTMAYRGSSEDLALTVFAHPTLSESLHEAALDVLGNAIHKARPGKR